MHIVTVYVCVCDRSNTEFSSQTDTQLTIKARAFFVLDRLRQVKYQNIGIGEKFRMKNEHMSANLRAFSYAVTYDLRDRGLTSTEEQLLFIR